MKQTNLAFSVGYEMSEFAREVKKGLSASRKKISSKFLYDSRGSELFCQIMELPEYYPTDAEIEIFETKAKEFFKDHLQNSFRLVELGAGDGLKTKILLNTLKDLGHQFEYVPVDICRNSIDGLTKELAQSLPNITVKGAVADYTDFFKNQSAAKDPVQNVVLFLGSNIGNFTPHETVRFLRGLRENLNTHDLMLIGFDLKKDINKLNSAYNDAQGITAQFNLNLLHRINNELSAEIDVSTFTHYGFYNPFSGAMESCLISTIAQDISIPGINMTVSFKEFEPLHLEYSFKYTPAEIDSLAHQTGFESLRQFRDSKNHFIDAIWKLNPHSLPSHHH